MRLKRDANKGVSIFFKSNKTDLQTNIIVDGRIIPIRYVKYMIDGKVFMMATNIFKKSVKQIQDLYKLRWRVELSFKRLKSHLKINKIYATSEMLWKQEMQLRILLDTITRTIQNAENRKIVKISKKRSFRYFLLSLLSSDIFGIKLRDKKAPKAHNIVAIKWVKIKT